MNAEASRLLEQALKLSPEARAALAGSLLESLDDAVDDEVETAWAVEISRRMAEIDSGAVKTVPWADVRRRILERIEDARSRA